jgi:hypothetical protein
LRGAGMADVLVDALKLMLFFIGTMAIASISNRKKRSISIVYYFI